MKSNIAPGDLQPINPHITIIKYSVNAQNNGNACFFIK